MTRSAAGTAIVLSLAALAPAAATEGPRSLRLIASPVFLPGVPVLVRLEVREADGSPAHELWDAEAELSAVPEGVVLSTTRVALRNGSGSAFLTVEGAEEFGAVGLIARVAGLEASGSLRDASQDAVLVPGAVLQGPLTEWRGVVRLATSLTVPAGATLRLLPGTLVLVEGVETDEGQPGDCRSTAETPERCGASILVQGTLESLGSEEAPVAITAREAPRAWGEIHHQRSAPSLYRFTHITRAGNSPRGGHTSTGPALRATESTVRLEDSALTDLAGKAATASSGASLELLRCHLARSVMGPEVSATAVLVEDSSIQDMRGTDDNDGIYLHAQRSGQEIVLRRTVVAGGDDDGVDTLGSRVTMEDCIVRDWANPDEDSKGVSVLQGELQLIRCLVVGCKVGISAKGQGGVGATVRLDRSTVADSEVGIQAEDKYGEPDLRIRYFVSSSIVRGEDAVRTDYPPADLLVRYSDLSEAWAGEGNLTVDPLFADAAGGSYRLRPGSPCINTGDPSAPPDPDGSRADMGAFPYQVPPPPGFTRGEVNGDEEVDLSDAVALLFDLFAGGPLPCLDAADVDDDGLLEIADPLRLLDLLFREGEPPPAPGLACGSDPTEDPLDCESPTCP